MKKISFLIATASLLIPLGSCQNDMEDGSLDSGNEMTTEWEPKKTPYMAIPLDTRAAEAVTSNNDFAIRFLSEICRDEQLKGQNITVSPFSVYTVLAILANADQGTASEEIINALTGNGKVISIEDINAYCEEMIEWLPKVDGTCNVSTANSIWTDKKYSLNPFTEKTISSVFSAEFFNNYSLASEDARLAINKWCEQKTSGKIPELLTSRLDDGMGAFIANTLYFRGCWKDQFNKYLNEEGDFFKNDGTKSNVTYMHQEMTVAFSNTNEYVYVSLPYGNGNYCMNLIVPKDMDIYAFVDKFSADDYSAAKLGREARKFEFAMPKFTANTDVNCNSYLEAMGVKDVFSTGLSSLLSGWIAPINTIAHVANISVDEEGTEGAAVTYSPAFGELNLEKGILTIDSPFLYFIEETSTGTILFEGIVADPSSK